MHDRVSVVNLWRRCQLAMTHAASFRRDATRKRMVSVAFYVESCFGASIALMSFVDASSHERQPRRILFARETFTKDFTDHGSNTNETGILGAVDTIPTERMHLDAMGCGLANATRFFA